MKKILCIFLVAFFLLLCGCSQSVEYTDPYKRMDDYLTSVLGWNDWDLLDYVKDRGLLYPHDLIDNDYIDIDDVMDYIISCDILSDYGYSDIDSAEVSHYDSSEYMGILQEIAYLVFSYEDGVSKSEIFDQIYDIVEGCTDPTGDVTLR